MKLVANQSSPNCYLFCISAILDVKLMRELGCDAIIKIDTPEKFIIALTESLGKIREIRWCGLGECIHSTRNQHYSQPKNTVPPVLLKETKHSYQKEVRIVWESLDNKIEPVIIESFKASAFCKVVFDGEFHE